MDIEILPFVHVPMVKSAMLNTPSFWTWCDETLGYKPQIEWEQRPGPGVWHVYLHSEEDAMIFQLKWG